MEITFAHASGLTARGGAVRALEIAGEDRVFQSAEGTIVGERLVVAARGVGQPVAVRYAWRSAPAANLFNGAGLPAAPFRTDDW